MRVTSTSPSFAAVSPKQPNRPARFGPPIDPGLLRFTEEVKEAAVSEWRNRVAEHGGKASLSPVGTFDPSKPLLVVYLGIGQDLRDAQAVAELSDKYQLVIGTYDIARPFEQSASELAEVFGELLTYRDQLSAARGEPKPSRDLRLVGHSFGGMVSQAFVRELAERKLVTDDADSPLTSVKHVNLDAPHRGVDVPLGGLIHGLYDRVVSKLPLPESIDRYADKFGAATRLLNSDGDVFENIRAKLPSRVTSHFGGTYGAGSKVFPGFGPEPVAHAYSKELGRGELEALQKFLLEGRSDLENLVTKNFWGVHPAVGLRNVLQVATVDADGADVLERLREAAKVSTDLKDFEASFDEIVGSVITTFQGEHTRFMWTDPNFAGWLEERLK